MDKMVEAEEECDLRGRVVELATNVDSKLGSGFLESAYQNALVIELRRVGIELEQNKPITVPYDGAV